MPRRVPKWWPNGWCLKWHCKIGPCTLKLESEFPRGCCRQCTKTTAVVYNCYTQYWLCNFLPFCLIFLFFAIEGEGSKMQGAHTPFSFSFPSALTLGGRCPWVGPYLTSGVPIWQRDTCVGRISWKVYKASSIFTQLAGRQHWGWFSRKFEIIKSPPESFSKRGAQDTRVPCQGRVTGALRSAGRLVGKEILSTSPRRSRPV